MPEKTPNIFEGHPAAIRLALCQVETSPWDTQGNLKGVLAALEAAAEQGAGLAITPECVFHGYGFDEGRIMAEKMRDAAEPLNGDRLAAIKKAVCRHRLPTVVGFAEAGPGGKYFNTAALIDAQGELVYVYRKIHCRDFESIEHAGFFTPGDSFHVATVPLRGHHVQVGTLICFDREIPESVRCLRALGAELIACPLACPTYRMDASSGEVDNEMITRVRAAENEVFIAVVNHAGRFNGGSFVVGPGGEVLHQMGSSSGVDIVEVPVGVISDAFRPNPWSWMGWGFRRPSVYQRYLAEVQSLNDETGVP